MTYKPEDLKFTYYRDSVTGPIICKILHEPSGFWVWEQGASRQMAHVKALRKIEKLLEEEGIDE